MSRHDDNVRLRHMRDAAAEAIALLGARSAEELRSDRLLELGLTRLVEIVGEAAARVSDGTRKRLPDIPWPQIVGMRNRLVHGYDRVDLAVLHATVRDELPQLIELLDVASHVGGADPGGDAAT